MSKYNLSYFCPDHVLIPANYLSHDLHNGLLQISKGTYTCCPGSPLEYPSLALSLAERVALVAPVYSITADVF